MDEQTELIYIAYLGRNKAKRIGVILKLVKTQGLGFFERFSTQSDTILEFINKLRVRGLL